MTDRPGDASGLQWESGIPIKPVYTADDLDRSGTPEDIGNAVVFMASDGAAWITGQCLYVNGGL